MPQAPVPTRIYHITHLRNLDLILPDAGLKCCATLRREGVGYVNIAHLNVQDRREVTQVPCGAGGVLHDYVPFYFAPRPPMLYVISRGGVEGYAEGQGPVVHLVSTAQRVAAAPLPFAFTDGHGTMALTDFYEDLHDLDAVDWSIMTAKYWADTPQDNDRSRRRQAEFLVHELFPWHLIEEIGVMNTGMRNKVEQVLEGAPHKPRVMVHPDWYY